MIQAFAAPLFRSASALLLLCIMVGPARGQVTQPNVVLIVTDDAGYADFGFQGSTDIPTPALDALANNGVIFNQAYTHVACSPSRAAFLTGAYTERWGHEANIQPVSNQLTQHYAGLPSQAVTVFERMQDLNYTTGVVGKWHVGGVDDVIVDGQIVSQGNKPPRQGVDEFIGFQAPGGLTRQSLNPDGTVNAVNASSGNRHWSDYWGDESVDFIDRHYQESDPFFLYASFNEPHTPIAASPYINDPRIAHLTGNRQRYASEMLSVDINVQRIVDKLEDPNGDGNTNDSILDETLFVFINDNGGATNNTSDNGDLRGFKGSPYEGGIRVPMFISGYGVDPTMAGTVYDEFVTSVDITGTIVGAGGGGPITDEEIYYGTQTYDGVNLLPFINGTAADDRPHNAVVYRLQEEITLVTPDWKLVKNGANADWQLFEFANTGTQSEADADDVIDQQPEVFAQLLRQLTDFEVGFNKQQFPSSDENIGQFNLFDDFTFRTDAFTNANWSSTNAWDSPQGTAETMRNRDSHNGTMVHFGTTDNNSYTATNDLRRMNELTFIAHGFAFEGDFNGAQDRSATLNGLPVLLAQNFAGEMPEFALDATGSGNNTFTFDLNQNVELYDDLHITGDGNQQFNLNGDIAEYRQGRQLIKTGSSTAHFHGDITTTGGADIQQGAAVFHSDASLTGDLAVQDGATVQVDTNIDGHINNAGRFVVPLRNFANAPTTLDLTPTLGDGDIDQRLSTTEGDQDTELLVGLVSNASSSTDARIIRALLSYDLADIPDDATINGVSLQLTHTDSDSNSNNNILGNLELRELTQDPVFNELGSPNVNWINRNDANNEAWSAAGGPLGDLLAQLTNSNLPNPATVSSGQTLDLDSLAAFLDAIANNLSDDALSLALLLPGEEAAGNSGTGNRDLYRFGTNESGQAAVLSIQFTAPQQPIAFTGDFTQQNTGSLTMALSESGHSQFQADGDANLAGELALEISPNLLPEAYASSFELIRAASVNGEFDRVTGLAIDAERAWAVTYSADAVHATAAYRGDADLDNDIDGTDFFAVVNNFTGSGQTGSQWAAGDFDGDGDADGTDFFTVVNNFSGSGVSPAAAAFLAQAADPNNPDLIYNPDTGEVTLHTDGVFFDTYQLLFANAGDFDDAAAQFAFQSFFAGGTTDLVDNEIFESNPTGAFLAITNGGNDTFSLGLILPTGLDDAQLAALFEAAQWSDATNASGSFDLIRIPEPTTATLLAAAGLLTLRRQHVN